MGINIRQTPGFDRSTSGIYEKLNAAEAESVKPVQEALKVEEGQIVEGTVCENKGQKSIQIQGEELPVSNEVVKDYNIGETIYLKVDTREEGKVSLKVLSSDEVGQIKAEQVKTEDKVEKRTSISHRNPLIGKSRQEILATSKKTDSVAGEIAKLIKSSKVTVTVSKDVEKAVEKVVKELDASQMTLLENQDVEVENTDIRTLSNMITNFKQQEQKEANKEEIMKSVVEKGKELSTFSDGKMYYMISNELELTVNNLYKAEYSYDKDHKTETLSKQEWEQLKPKVEEYLKKEQIAPNEENMNAAKWLMDQKLPINKANVADVKAMQTMNKEGVEEAVLENNVKHYFELNLDPKEANVFYENEGKVAQKLMQKVNQLEEKDIDVAIEQLVKEEKPLTLDNIIKEVYKQEELGQTLKEVVSKEKVSSEEEKRFDKKTKDRYEMADKTVPERKEREVINRTNPEITSTKSENVTENTNTVQESESAKETKVEVSKDKNVEAKESGFESDSKKETGEVEKDILEFEKILDELDEKDVNYRKIENHQKRNQEEKEKKEEIPSAKEEVSYEQLGKSFLKRQPKRFQMKDLTVSEELKSKEKELVKEEGTTKVENLNEKEETKVSKEDSKESLKEEHVDSKESTKVILNKDLETETNKEVKDETKTSAKIVETKGTEKQKISKEDVETKETVKNQVPNVEEDAKERVEHRVSSMETDKKVKIENQVPSVEVGEKERVENQVLSVEVGEKERVENQVPNVNVEMKETEENQIPRVNVETKETKDKKALESDMEGKETNNTSGFDAQKEVKTKENTLKEAFEKEWQKENPVLSMLLDESKKASVNDKDSSDNVMSGNKEEILVKEETGAKVESLEGKNENGLKENAKESGKDQEKTLPLNEEVSGKKVSEEHKDSVSKEMQTKEVVREFLSKEQDNRIHHVSKEPMFKDKVGSNAIEKEPLQKEQNKIQNTSEKDIPKAQNREESPSLNGAELEAKIITAKRQLEEIRLKLTLSSAKVLAKNDIKIDTKELSEIVEQLKELEKEACRRQLIENRIEPTEENVEQLRTTTKMAEELKEMPSYSIAKFVREPIPMTMEGLHEEGRRIKSDFDAANERYETMMTKPRSDMGDSINKAFRNVDDILKEMDLEVTEANQRAVRILGYNSMEITEENLEAVKAKDLSVNRLLNQLTPQTVMEFIRKGENIIQIPIEELNLKMENMNNEAQEKEVARYSEFLYKLEKNKEITSSERNAFVGVYRLLDKVVKSKGRDIGALVKSGQEITLKNLLTAQRTIKASKIDANIDDDFGMVSEVIEKGIKITDQIEQGFANPSKKTSFEPFTKGNAKTLNVSSAGTKNVSDFDWQSNMELNKEESKTVNVQMEEQQQVEQRQQTKQDSLVQQKVSYQQDLAKEILDYIQPSDLKSLSKVFGNNLENLTFEQIRDRLSRNNGKSFETGFNGEPALDEYQEEQMKEWKQLAQTEQRVIKALSDYDVSKTLSNAKAFETIFSKETPLFEQIKKEFEPKTKKEDKDKKIQKSISSLGGFFEGKEEAIRAYDDFAQDLMDQSGAEENLTTKDILARKNYMLAGNLMAKMAREESFIVPVQIQNKDTTMEVTLKSDGNQKGTIKASVALGTWGEITAELLVEETSVLAYSNAESRDGEVLLSKALNVFEGMLSSKNITFKQSFKPINGIGKVDTKQLYQVAKSFVEAFRA